MATLRFNALCATGLIAALPIRLYAAAPDFSIGPLLVHAPWARETPPTAGVGAVYLIIFNRGRTPDALIGASSSAAAAAAIHETRLVNGVMQMRPVESVELPPGGEVRIEPGGLHIMLSGLKAPLRAGTEVPLTLRFKSAGELNLRVRVAAQE